MNDMTLIDTTDAVAAPVAVVSNIDRFVAGTKALQKAFARATQADESLFGLRVEIQQLREQVSAALNGNGDFDGASKAFKAANNKLDKAIDARDAALSTAAAGVAALNNAINDLSVDLLDLED